MNCSRFELLGNIARGLELYLERFSISANTLAKLANHKIMPMLIICCTSPSISNQSNAASQIFIGHHVALRNFCAPHQNQHASSRMLTLCMCIMVRPTCQIEIQQRSPSSMSRTAQLPK